MHTQKAGGSLMMAAKVFKGTNVFMSRNLVPPELFDALHDALKLNGAQVFLCCDPSRNGPSDYHVIASAEHEKFEDLRSKGCKLIGPQCVLSCAKEHRALPNQGFTCCLGMDGVNILASGFEKDEKADILKMVTAMGGVLQTKASSDVSFVIVKNVLAQKYKWALNNLKKPIVTLNWLLQCWKEHRVIPQESYRVLPFSGLTICVSGIPADERKEVEKLVLQNGGKYSAELTKRCTHLVCDAPEGDKYKVAKRWGHIYRVTRKWFHQSVARKACLSEESYPVQGISASSVKLEQLSQGKVIRNSQHTSSSLAAASDLETNFSAQDTEPDHENTLPDLYSTFSEVPSISKEGNDQTADNETNDSNFAPCVADDSQSEDDDLYLSECRIRLVGFEVSEMRKLVDMVRRGGGSRYMSFNEKLTHVVVGNPSEIEIKEVRSLAAFGIIYVVKTTWLEECTSKKKEVPVLQRHIAYDVLLPKDPVFVNKTTAPSMTSVAKVSASQTVEHSIWDNKYSQPEALHNAKLEVQSVMSKGTMQSSTVFNGKLFCFSSSFPEEQRPEIVLWVKEGGGKVVTDKNQKNVHFTVERHGVMPCSMKIVRSTYVSTHWIRSCLQDGCLLDVSSHILYSPLPCQIPLPGFEGHRLCVSRYDMKERQLLRNLCYVLGVKFMEKLTKKVTHLLTKFADGDKYDAACRWGIHIVTADWIYECVMQNKVVDVKKFYPKELTSEDREMGLYFASQYPSQLQNLRSMQTVAEDENYSNSDIKKAKLSGNDCIKHPLPFLSKNDETVDRKIPTDNNATETTKGVPSIVPDVAAAIDDLLEQTCKLPASNYAPLDQSHVAQHSDSDPDPGPSNHWTNINRSDKGDDNPSTDAAAKGLYDGFSETQTDSQVVGYEEDLSGRQMIIDRVRTRSSMT